MKFFAKYFSMLVVFIAALNHLRYYTVTAVFLFIVVALIAAFWSTE